MSTTELSPLEEDLLARLDTGRLAEHVARLAAPGDRAERDRGVGYLRAVLRGWGLPLALQRFEFVARVPGPVYFSLARRNAPVEAVAQPYSGATPTEGLTAELRLVDDPQEALAGAVALVDARPTPDRIAALTAAGAVAQVYISPDDTPVATPLAELAEPASTPVIAIGRAVGEGFLALHAAGATPVRLRVPVATKTRRLTVPLATIPGVDEPEEYILTGAALDPAAGEAGVAGAACLLALCGAFAAERGRLRRGLRFVWWPGSVGPGVAARWYVAREWENLGRHAAVYLELGRPAPEPPGDTTQPGLAGHEQLRWFGVAALRDGGVATPAWWGRLPMADAPAFAGLGVPTLAFTPARNHDPTALAREAALGLLLAARLGAYPVLPFDVVATPRAIEARAHDIVAAAGETSELLPLRARTSACRAAAERLQLAALHVAQGEATHYEEGLARLNQAARQVNRLLTPLLHRAGDRYVTMWPTTELLPGLTASHAARGQPEVGPELAAGRATLLRERNRLLDALHEATRTIAETLDALQALGIG